MANGLARCRIELLRIKDHLLRMHRRDSLDRHGAITGVLEIDDEFDWAVTCDPPDSADGFLTVGQKYLKAFLDGLFDLFVRHVHLCCGFLRHPRRRKAQRPGIAYSKGEAYAAVGSAAHIAGAGCLVQEPDTPFGFV